MIKWDTSAVSIFDEGQSGWSRKLKPATFFYCLLSLFVFIHMCLKYEKIFQFEGGKKCAFTL